MDNFFSEGGVWFQGCFLQFLEMNFSVDVA
jgi:hypothetical protein